MEVRELRRWLMHTLIATVLLTGGLTISPSPVQAARTGGCYGAGCTGLDPTNRCDGDARTVASIAVGQRGVPYSDMTYSGQLDLRYSPSCKANWGRFTIYSRYWNAIAMGAPTPLWGETWAWNPGGHSQGPVDPRRPSWPSVTSTWTKMVDGIKKACTGVRVFWISSYKDSNTPNVQSADWTWGPCV